MLQCIYTFLLTIFPETNQFMERWKYQEYYGIKKTFNLHFWSNSNSKTENIHHTLTPCCLSNLKALTAVRQGQSRFGHISKNPFSLNFSSHRSYICIVSRKVLGSCRNQSSWFSSWLPHWHWLKWEPWAVFGCSLSIASGFNISMPLPGVWGGGSCWSFALNSTVKYFSQLLTVTQQNKQHLMNSDAIIQSWICTTVILYHKMERRLQFANKLSSYLECKLSHAKMLWKWLWNLEKFILYVFCWLFWGLTLLKRWQSTKGNYVHVPIQLTKRRFRLCNSCIVIMTIKQKM